MGSAFAHERAVQGVDRVTYPERDMGQDSTKGSQTPDPQSIHVSYGIASSKKSLLPRRGSISFLFPMFGFGHIVVSTRIAASVLPKISVAGAPASAWRG